jgi:hypothetical protein
MVSCGVVQEPARPAVDFDPHSPASREDRNFGLRELTSNLSVNLLQSAANKA